MNIRYALYICLIYTSSVPAFQESGIIDKHLFDLVSHEVSGILAKEHVRYISENHRVQATAGYLKAAEYIKGKLEKYGVNDIKMHKYKSDGKTRYNGITSPLSWSVKSAVLKMEKPYERTVADYSKIATSLTTLSNGGNWRGELIDVGEGISAEDYDGRDIRNKIVMAYGYAAKVHREAVIKRGAMGVVIRPAEDDRPELVDAVRYNGLWPTAGEIKKVGFGFQISRRTSENLLELIESGEKIVLNATVSAKIHPGKLVVLSALIPGSSNSSEQFVLISHLDHYKPGANDNASGSAAILEIARVIKQLVKSGKISQPKRSIRFLWVPEHFGTMAYLTKNIDELDGAFAGLNLDMVGEDTNLTNSQLEVIKTPASSPTFLNDLIAEVVREVEKRSVRSAEGSDNLFNYTVLANKLGSDHDMLNDPLIGIPTVALGYWSDIYHHTNEDSLDKIDPTTMKRSIIIGAYTALWLANAGNKEADKLALLVFARARQRIIETGLEVSYSSDENSGIESLRYALSKIDLQTDVDIKAINSIKGLRSTDEAVEEMYTVAIEELGESEKKIFLGRLGMTSIEAPDLETGKAARIPERKFIGPVYDSYADIWFENKLGNNYEWYRNNSTKHFDLIRYEIVNHMNGARNISQIHRIVNAEYGPFDIAVTERIIDDLAKLKLVKWVKI